ncbi:YbhB/YbcL family Raf kinase inhibitor-like protein [Weissella viridescens]|uniref:YbhB/YbcL family Raf kinase inhibitor-like protein n=1 Tax=Weissella viridescens TaxID=1629 RepID=A0A3P2RLY4_WEIVI|nr:YbhB/YbcL family Raf kinase inhibitor-like protein [Weissella viridescens]RRG18682.1 YbhB/YbcL family Raf kinase inhibitor-like protein [Weissella viridescens]
MQIKIELDADGDLPDLYAKAAPETATVNGTPVISFPFEVLNIPKSANYLAWTLIDADAIPVTGFAWIHWTMADVPVTGRNLVIPADFSRETSAGVQGLNSQASKFVGETDPALTMRYTGPMPPDQPHAYRLEVFAMPELLGLVSGYFLNEQYRALTGNVLEKTHLDIWAKN